jgi:N-hydroxyarylamine O-acetyltransferase
LRDGDWTSLYWFDRAPCYPVDIDIVNFYHSHAPESFFFQNRVIALAERDCRKTLTNGALRITRGKIVESREITDGEPYYAVLRDEFGIVLAEEEWRHLRALPQNA